MMFHILCCEITSENVEPVSHGYFTWIFTLMWNIVCENLCENRVNFSHGFHMDFTGLLPVVLEQQLRTLQNSEPPAQTNHETAAKVDRNNLTEIHQQCSLPWMRRSVVWPTHTDSQAQYTPWLELHTKAAWRGGETRNFQLKGSNRSAEGSWAISCRLWNDFTLRMVLDDAFYFWRALSFSKKQWLL